MFCTKRTFLFKIVYGHNYLHGWCLSNFSTTNIRKFVYALKTIGSMHDMYTQIILFFKILSLFNII